MLMWRWLLPGFALDVESMRGQDLAAGYRIHPKKFRVGYAISGADPKVLLLAGQTD